MLSGVPKKHIENAKKIIGSAEKVSGDCRTVMNIVYRRNNEDIGQLRQTLWDRNFGHYSSK